MLFQRRFLEGLRCGAITVAFRRWRRPSVRAGGTLLTPVGQLAITSVEITSLARLTAADARAAGYDRLDELRAALEERTEGDIYRIGLGVLLDDPRIALRATVALDDEAQAALLRRLDRLDAHGTDGPWTERTMAVIAAHPAVRAGDICRLLGQEKEPFKLNVRKLKALGLTESLGTGYRLSPRGEALMRLRS